jgi:transposase
MTMLDAASAAPHQPADDPTIWEVDDELWADLQPLLVIDKPRKKPGRPRANDRRIFNGLIWLARTGAQWETLPRRFGPKSTAHDRFQEWVFHGCLVAAWALLLERYDEEIGLQWEWQAADGCIVKAPLGKRGRTASPKRPAATRPTEARVAARATC